MLNVPTQFGAVRCGVGVGQVGYVLQVRQLLETAARAPCCRCRFTGPGAACVASHCCVIGGGQIALTRTHSHAHGALLPKSTGTRIGIKRQTGATENRQPVWPGGKALLGRYCKQKGLSSIPLRLSFLFKSCGLWTRSCVFLFS